jgi:hypothetical protein
METSANFVIPPAEHELLLSNGHLTEAGVQHDPPPVVRLFMTDADAFWLLFDLNPAQPHLGLAYYDLGVGLPRLGPVSLAEIADFRGREHRPVLRDNAFEPKLRLSAYAQYAAAYERLFA